MTISEKLRIYLNDKYQPLKANYFLDKLTFKII